MFRLAPIAAAALTIGLLATTAPAHAYTADRVPRASHRIVGVTVVNHHTHVHTTIIGTYRYHRRSHHHRITVRGIVVSAQRCWSGECHGPAREGRLWSPYQIGRAPKTSSRGPQAGAAGDFCLAPSGTYCAAPWNWFNRHVDKALRHLTVDVAQPCAAGAFAGFGTKLAGKLGGLSVAEGATIATSERVAGVLGPEGYAAVSVGGCFFGIGAHGILSVKSMLASINPFGRTGVTR